MEEQGRAEGEKSAREFEHQHLEENEGRLGNTVEEVEPSDSSGHDVTVHNGDWLAWNWICFLVLNTCLCIFHALAISFACSLVYLCHLVHKSFI